MCTRRQPFSASSGRRCAAAPSPSRQRRPLQLQQCLTAQVHNALLYSDGPVTIAVSSGSAAELLLHVIDLGLGTAGLASPHRGSGIGLSVVRLLIEALERCEQP